MLGIKLPTHEWWRDSLQDPSTLAVTHVPYTPICVQVGNFHTPCLASIPTLCELCILPVSSYLQSKEATRLLVFDLISRSAWHSSHENDGLINNIKSHEIIRDIGGIPPSPCLSRNFDFNEQFFLFLMLDNSYELFIKNFPPPPHLPFLKTS